MNRLFRPVLVRPPLLEMSGWFRPFRTVPTARPLQLGVCASRGFHRCASRLSHSVQHRPLLCSTARFCSSVSTSHVTTHELLSERLLRWQQLEADAREACESATLGSAKSEEKSAKKKKKPSQEQLQHGISVLVAAALEALSMGGSSSAALSSASFSSGSSSSSSASVVLPVQSGPLPHAGFYVDAVQGDPCVTAGTSGEGSNAGEGSKASDGWTARDLELVAAEVKAMVERGEQFHCITATPKQAMHVLAHNRLACNSIALRPDQPVHLVRCGHYVGIAHLPLPSSTSDIHSFELSGSGSVLWNDGAHEVSLQRVRGAVFGSERQEEEWRNAMAEMEAADHRVQGKAQQLFLFHPCSPGAPFFLPAGTRLFHTLMQYIREQYIRRGFLEVISPNVMSRELWHQSGHWHHYKENMFAVASASASDASTSSPEAIPGGARGCCGDRPGTQGEATAERLLKPMNCPGHCLIFASTARSHRELPVRLAEFGTLHRDELAGALTGLTRVTRFHQDDAHIFCTPQQVRQEVAGCLNMIREVYETLGIASDLTMQLSTRPVDQSIGSDEQWQEAEAALEAALEESGAEWSVNAGDGAFYGPKIDVSVGDAHGRVHQCGTVQLDFQLPERFELEYVSAENRPARPVMIHRAVLGSIERMIAMLLEQYRTQWPAWLSPRPVLLVPLSESTRAHVEQLQLQLKERGVWAEVCGDVKQKLGARIRAGVHAGYNYTVVVGEKEMERGEVAVRKRGSRESIVMPLEAFAEEVESVIKRRTA